MSTTYGIDVSKWQASINWPMVKNSGKVDFVIMKAGYGNQATQKDPRFEENYKGCKANNIPCGCYWYSYAMSVAEAEREADACLKAISGKQFEYPIYLDIEESKQFKLGRQTVSNMVNTFCKKLEAAGYFVGVYSSKSHFDSYMNDDVKKKYTIWVAHYGVSKTTYSGPYDIWQKSDKGKISGINGYVDLDECYRDFPTLIKSLGKNGFPKTVDEKPVETLKPTEPTETINEKPDPVKPIKEPEIIEEKPIEPIPVPPMPKLFRRIKVICNALYVRSAPTMKGIVLDVIYNGDIVEIEEDKDGWGRIANTERWICLNLSYVTEVN